MVGGKHPHRKPDRQQRHHHGVDQINFVFSQLGFASSIGPPETKMAGTLNA